MSVRKIEGWNVLFGCLLWLGALLWERPHPLTFAWPLLMVLLGALVMVPAGRWLLIQHFHEIENLRLSRWVALGQLPSALALLVSAQLTPCWASSLWVIPWQLVTLGMAWLAVRNWGLASLGQRVALAGWLQIVVGGAWLLADRAALEPMGFDGQIVRLTAAHFHFAGFVLPLMAGLMVMQDATHWVRFTSVGAAGGVLLVALGITLTKLGLPVEWECGLALGFCGLVLAVAFAQMRLAVRLRNAWLLGSGVALFLGTCLAGIYASRIWLPCPWLQIPRMWALHGTLQAAGFAGVGIYGWYRQMGITLKACT